MTNEATVTEINRVVGLFELLPDVSGIYAEWFRLIDQHKIVGKRGHDTRLVAAMKVHGLARIATFNARDFARYAEVELLSPEELATAWATRSPSVP